ncbi:phytanoyl-CoA dioxygenase family protein [Candidatus Poribacteria bacterium]|nr:phytanoyl-CoA dioxygenase family protein [Candidatus Poribacteria bacterium]MYK18520.1 phytanoyl-CoA dioxygenase family protein [Candidatus Poribacteria bacterium]
MKVNRTQFMEEGYLVVREVIPPEELDALRESYELMVSRQREIWSRERSPNDPPGGVWETSAQPRLLLGRDPLAGHVDEKTASAIEIWAHENMQGISSELLGAADAGVTEMMLMCNPVRDCGPATWHRDHHPIDTAPLLGYIDDIMETGPRYVQWNLSLYDDSVLWVLPGSHLRVNTEAENEQLLTDPKVPLPSALQTHLNAGDGVVYILPILHWGSNYSRKMRRTIHGGFSNYTHYPTSDYIEYLSPEVQGMFDRWNVRSNQMKVWCEEALRAAIKKDANAYHAALEKLHPDRGKKGKILSTVFLCKAACFVAFTHGCELEDIPDELKNRGKGPHAITLNWGPSFAEDRFTKEEASLLWERFKPLDALLKTDEELYLPGFQSGPMHYYFNEMPANFGVADFIETWGL